MDGPCLWETLHCVFPSALHTPTWGTIRVVGYIMHDDIRLSGWKAKMGYMSCCQSLLRMLSNQEMSSCVLKEKNCNLPSLEDQRPSRNIHGIYNIIMMCFKASHMCPFHMKVKKTRESKAGNTLLNMHESSPCSEILIYISLYFIERDLTTFRSL